MSIAAPHSTRSISVERVIWYSDAVVGIMQTFLAALLVDSLADLATTSADWTGPPDQAVSEWLSDQGSRFFSHIVVFFMLIYLWRRHHEMYRHIKKLNRGTLWLNSAFLACVCLVPFATSLVARSNFTAISLASLFGVLSLALFTQLALFHHARRTGLTSEDSGSGLTALRLYILIPAVVALAAAAVAAFLSYFNVVGSALMASSVLLLGLTVHPILSRYLSRHPTSQPPEAMEIKQNLRDRVKDGPLKPLQQFFAGSSPDRSLLFSDSVYAISMTLMSVQLVSRETSELSGDDVAQIIADTFMPDFTLGNFWTFVVIFVFIQVMWLQHVRIFLFVSTIGSRTLWLNATHLFTIVMLPLLFGIIGAAPLYAVVPWWLTAAGMLACIGSLSVLTWSCLIYRKVQTPAARNAVRVSLTENAYLVVVTLVAIAPLGLLDLALPLLLIKDPVVNFVWRNDGAARSFVDIIRRNPNFGIGERFNPWAAATFALFVLVCAYIEYLRSDFWLIHPIG